MSFVLDKNVCCRAPQQFDSHVFFIFFSHFNQNCIDSLLLHAKQYKRIMFLNINYN